MQNKKNWLQSEEARRMLRGSSCDLMHLREAGKLRFENQGNAFSYATEDVEREAAERRKKTADARGTQTRSHGG